MSSSQDQEINMVAEELPFDLLLDIFSRLPAKTLARFRCSSKTFLNHLTSPYFRQLHHQKSSKNPFLISLALSNQSADWRRSSTVLVRKDYVLSMIDHKGEPISQFHEKIEIDDRLSTKIFLLPSHQNLVCLSSTNRIYVFNPSKHEFVELPKGFNFDSRADMVGFGYVPSKDVYKVVRLFYKVFDYHNYYYDVGVEILTISNYNGSNNNNIIQSCSSWRVLDGEDLCRFVVEGKSVSVNGLIHWKINDYCCDREKGVEEILSFDLEDEKFLVLPFPRFAIEDASLQLVELRGNLWGSVSKFRGDDYIMDMWVLKDFDKFDWVKEYSINLDYFERFCGEVIGEMFNVINVNHKEE
ncbi:hypothetical protein CCACVL1_19828 [Corchorus capsularis]|uniref:F-box domain-containing protein n=1 Tax=Corchorus capsularis TaxID=210143 RepID=A0A1R3HEQ2_COCAP|nr:hypothetical protein CCACVL1_19828 [Corchorus capsularis]